VEDEHKPTSCPFVCATLQSMVGYTKGAGTGAGAGAEKAGVKVGWLYNLSHLI